jgi:MerR family transcriptional regulator, thiopeptide resistance regulator
VDHDRDPDDPISMVRVGDLAASAGLSVRTLHHYEEIGLVEPTTRTESGHRLYDASAIARLYRVLRLRELDMPLRRVGALLDGDAAGIGDALAGHLDGLDGEIDRLVALRDGLARALAGTVARTDSIDDWMEVLIAMSDTNRRLKQRISILVYRDLERVHDHLVDVFGLAPGELTRAPDGTVVHAEVYGGDGVIWLHPETDEFGLASPVSVGRATAMMAIMVDDVDEHHDAVVAKGGDIVYAPVDQPYGYREYGARDCEGTLWSFMKPLAN